MLVNESEMLSILDESKSIALVEPRYKTKMLPLGLAKIASYTGATHFSRGIESEADLFCITTLFTYNSKEVFNSIDEIGTEFPDSRILIGGVFASLMPKVVDQRFPNEYIFVGCSKTLDYTPPNYNLNYGLEEPWASSSYVFTTRGCPNHCAYCAVPRIEPEKYVIENWREHINLDFPHAVVYDNNLSSFPQEHVESIFKYFSAAKIKLHFDNGFDCKYITPEFAKVAASVEYFHSGCRLSFDRVEEDGIFQTAVTNLLNAGIKKSDITSYVLFNFNDTPKDTQYRMEECLKLGIRPYPAVFTPLNILDKTNPFIGKHWTYNLVRALRFFYLMGGLYRNFKFNEWLEVSHTLSGYKNWIFTDEDKEKYYGHS